MTVRNHKPVPGKRVTYLDEAIKGFGVRVTENGIKTYVLTYGEDRKRVKPGYVGIVALKDARDKAKDILAKRQLNEADDMPSIDFGKGARPHAYELTGALHEALLAAGVEVSLGPPARSSTTR